MRLIRERNLADADEVYEQLIALHAHRSPEESLRLDARLLIALFNHIGDVEVITEAIELAAGQPAQAVQSGETSSGQ